MAFLYGFRHARFGGCTDVIAVILPCPVPKGFHENLEHAVQVRNEPEEKQHHPRYEAYGDDFYEGDGNVGENRRNRERKDDERDDGEDRPNVYEQEGEIKPERYFEVVERHPNRFSHCLKSPVALENDEEPRIGEQDVD